MFGAKRELSLHDFAKAVNLKCLDFPASGSDTWFDEMLCMYFEIENILRDIYMENASENGGVYIPARERLDNAGMSKLLLEKYSTSLQWRKALPEIVQRVLVSKIMGRDSVLDICRSLPLVLNGHQIRSFDQDIDIHAAFSPFLVNAFVDPENQNTCTISLVHLRLSQRCPVLIALLGLPFIESKVSVSIASPADPVWNLPKTAELFKRVTGQPVFVRSSKNIPAKFYYQAANKSLLKTRNLPYLITDNVVWVVDSDLTEDYCKDALEQLLLTSKAVEELKTASPSSQVDNVTFLPEKGTSVVIFEKTYEDYATSISLPLSDTFVEQVPVENKAQKKNPDFYKKLGGHIGKPPQKKPGLNPGRAFNDSKSKEVGHNAEYHLCTRLKNEIAEFDPQQHWVSSSRFQRYPRRAAFGRFGVNDALGYDFVVEGANALFGIQGPDRTKLFIEVKGCAGAYAGDWFMSVNEIEKCREIARASKDYQAQKEKTGLWLRYVIVFVEHAENLETCKIAGSIFLSEDPTLLKSLPEIQLTSSLRVVSTQFHVSEIEHSATPHSLFPSPPPIENRHDARSCKTFGCPERHDDRNRPRDCPKGKDCPRKAKDHKIGCSFNHPE